MINYKTGNLVASTDEAVVNTVNTVGVMGKGIALQFKENYPSNYKAYVAACKSGDIGIGKLFVFDESDLNGRKLIVNFPTKQQWRFKSKYEYIEKGLDDLKNVIIKYSIKSISIPPLGCGNGGLDWNVVKEMIESKLNNIKGVEINIYAPNDNYKAVLKAEAKERVDDKNLDDAQAMLIYAMFCYESNGEDCSLFVANKLAYFMHRLGDTSFAKFRFVAAHYGPYDRNIAKILYDINGKFILGLEQNEAKPFDSLELIHEKKSEISHYVRNNLTNDQINTLKYLLNIISGFESSFSLELLSSVDYVIRSNPDMTMPEVMDGIQKWSSRKKELFKEEYFTT